MSSQIICIDVVTFGINMRNFNIYDYKVKYRKLK